MHGKKVNRTGGSLPAIIEADDDGLYVLKFRGAGQGVKALIAELVAGEIGRALGLPVPELVFVELDGALGRNEPDSEIRSLIQASVGLNLALDYLPGSFAYNPVTMPALDALLASSVVWFDAFVTNIDRTARNTNMLLWHKYLWLIDHGAALYFHHAWGNYLEQARSPFVAVKQHVLLPQASALEEAGALLPQLLTAETLRAIVAAIPDEWLCTEAQFAGAEAHRSAYSAYLETRLAASPIFVEEALRARAQLV